MKGKIFMGALASFSLFLILSACDIGLGGAVDTESPSVKITSPETSAVLKDNISVQGSWSDDQKLSRLAVSIADVEKNNAVVSTGSANINDNGSWNYTLYTLSSSGVPSGASVLSDGKYEIKAVGYDDAGHASGESSRTIEIDTTAPVVALSKPSSVLTPAGEIKGPSLFGRSVKIKGLISDDHSIDNMKISIWKEDGTPVTLAKDTFTDFDPTDAAITIADYSAADDSDLKNNYLALYGNSIDNEAQNYTAVVTFTDKAGNTSEKTFFRTNLLSLVKDKINQSLEMADLKNILNGSYKGSLSASDIQIVKDILSGNTEPLTDEQNNILYYVADTNAKLTFKIDSNANPKYQLLGGYKVEGNSFKTLEEDASLSFKVEQGLDQVAFYPSSLKVKITKLDEADKSVTIEPTKIYESESNPISEISSATENGTYTIRLADVSNKNPEFIKSASTYKFEVIGTDSEGSKFIAYNNNIYGFEVKTSANPSVVTCGSNQTYVKAAELAKSDNQKIYVTVTDELANAKVKVNAWVAYYTNEIKNDLTFDTIKANATQVITDREISGSTVKTVEVPVTDTSKLTGTGLNNCTVAIAFSAQANGARPEPVAFFIYADNAAPTLRFTNKELTGDGTNICVFENGSSYKYKEGSETKTGTGTGFYDEDNGVYSVSGIWEDVIDNVRGSGVTKLYYKVDNEEWKTIVNSNVGIQATNNFWNQKIEITDQGKHTLKFKAEDAVGNQTEEKTFTDVVFDFAAPVLYCSKTLDEYYTLSSNENIEITLRGEDSYGINAILPVVTRTIDQNVTELTAGTDYTITPLEKISGDSKKQKRVLTFKRNNANLNGLYSITATVTDDAGRSSSSINNNGVTKSSLTFNIDATPPEFESIKVKETALSETDYYGNEALSITVSYTENNEMDALYYWVKTPDSNDLDSSVTDLSSLKDSNDKVISTEVSFKAGQKSVKTTIEFANNSGAKPNILYIQGKDKAGNLSEIKQFNVNLDTSDPEVKALKYMIAGDADLTEAGGTAYSDGSKTITVYGSYSDEQSGVKELVLSASGADITYSTTEVTASTTKAQFESIEFKEYNDTNFPDKTKIKSWKAEFIPAASGAVSGTAKNCAERPVTFNLFSVALDTSAPTINSFSLIEVNGEEKKTAFSKTDSFGAVTYYVNPAEPSGKKYKITGKLVDDLMLKDITLSITNGQEVITPIEKTISTFTKAVEDFTFEESNDSGFDLKDWTKDATVSMTVSDKAGNSYTKTFKIIFDKTGPVGMHKVDDSTKDLYFRIGNDDNEVLDSSADKEVGGKYSDGTYGNASTIKIRGKIDDTASGVNTIYYKVYDKPVSTTSTDDASKYEKFADDAALIEDVINNKTGSFAPLSKAVEKRVFFNVKTDNVNDPTKNLSGIQYSTEADSDGYYKFYKTIENNYDATISGFENPENYLVIVAVDNVGNKGLDFAMVYDQTENKDLKKIFATLNIDTIPPVVTKDDSSAIHYINVKEEVLQIDSSKVYKFIDEAMNTKGWFEIKGTVDDYKAGVEIEKKVTSVKIGSHTITQTENEYGVINFVSANETNNPRKYNWTVKVYPKAFYDLSGTVVITGVFKDKAGSGNTTEMPISTVLVDVDPPTVTLGSPTPIVSGKVNKKISFAGTISDDNVLPTVAIEKMQYSKMTSAAETETWSDWNDMPSNAYSKTGAYSYSVTNFNTESLDNNSTYKIRAVAKDQAGNLGYSNEQTVVVNQDSDRPNIILQGVNLNTSGTTYLKGTTTLRGTVEDDDGSVTSIKYALGTGAADESTPTSWTDVTREGDSWSISNLVEKTGGYVIWFKVVDKAGTPFTSKAENSLNAPKITDGTNSVADNANLAFTVVTKQPDVDDISYDIYTEITKEDNSKENEKLETRTTLGTLGGDYKKFKVSLKAKATSGISSVTVKFSDDIHYDLECIETHNDANYHTWKSKDNEYIDISTLDGIKTFDIIVRDGITSDPMEKIINVDFDYDNTPPAISIKAPSGTVGVKQTMEFTSNESCLAYFVVTKNDVTEDDVKVYADNQWTDVNNTDISATDNYVLSESVIFDDVDNEAKNHTDRFALYLVKLGICTLDQLNDPTSPFETFTDVKFWIKAKDRCGNISYTPVTVNVDPQGNRPSLSLQASSGTLKEGKTDEYQDKTTGGSIRFDGTTSDDVGAKYVWIQIDSTGIKTDSEHTSQAVASDGFKYDDLKKLKDAGYKIGNMRTNLELTDDQFNALTAASDVSNYGIMVDVNSGSWNKTINEKAEFNVSLKDSDGNTFESQAILNITFYATDADVTNGVTAIHRSRPIKQTIYIDSQRPYFKQDSLKLVQGTSSQNYSQGTSIHGIWYLQGTIIDADNGIKTVSINGTPVVEAAGESKSNIDGNSNYYITAVVKEDDKDITETETVKKRYDYNFSIPIGDETPDKVGRFSVTISATEATTHELTEEKEFIVTFDNKAPEWPSDGRSFDEEVKNQNGFFTFGAKASEPDVDNITQSGVERIAFYFTRDLDYGLQTKDASTYSSHTGNKTHDLFDVMIYHENTDTNDVASGNMIVNYTDESTSALKEDSGLYWRELTGTVDGTSFIPTDTNYEVYKKNIHKGGLAKINGVIYLINSVSSTGVTLTTSASTASTPNQKAYFAICNVIDKSGEKSGSEYYYDKSADDMEKRYGYGYYSDSTFEDGDLMIETFNKQGTDWFFDASINSKNLPDGPVTVHLVAFDKAGNCSEVLKLNYSDDHKYSGIVKNNAPRIAGLKIGTDINGNGEVDDEADYSEYNTTYVNQYENGYKGTASVTDVTFPLKARAEDEQKSLFKIKGKTVVKPEIVGGNGKISYNYAVYDYDSSNKKWNTTAGAFVSRTGGELGVGKTDEVAELSDIVLTVEDFVKPDSNSKVITDGELKNFTFSFIDSTPGFTNSSSNTDASTNISNLSVILDVAIRDTTAAENYVLPFYWTAANKNSLFNQSAEQGHIELAKDWVTTSSYSGTSGVYDNDPKVSGKIKIEGLAYDESLLSNIKVSFSKRLGGTGGFAENAEVTIATYDDASASWTTTALEEDGSINSIKGWASAVQQATYQDLLDTKIIEVLPANTEATARVPYTSQDYGHVVHWILYLDTALFDGVTASDVVITTKATHRGSPSWSGSTITYASGTAVSVTGSAYSGAVTKSGTSVKIGDFTGLYRMDVVPYIKEVKRTTNITNNYRARSGAVSLLRGEAANAISGFNLGTKTNTSIKIYPNKNGSGTDKVDMTSVDLSGSDLTFTVPDTAKSGYLHVVVNNVAALNNMNGYVDYNTETNAKAYDHNTLTDDRYVHIWRVSQQDTFKGSKNAVYPAMTKASDGTLYASFTNYGQSKTYYTNQFIGSGTVGVSDYKGVEYSFWDGYYANDAIQDNGVATLFWGYDPPEETSIALNSDGDVSVFYAANYHGGADSHWDGTSATNAGGIYVYDTHATDTQIQNNGNNSKQAKIYRSELYTYDDELNQFKNIRITRTSNYIYIAYYDRLRGSIKTSVINDTNGSRPNTSANGLPWVTLDGGYDNVDNAGTGFSFAGGWKPFLNTNYSDGVSARAASTGESVAITTSKNGCPVVFYMDSNGHPRIARASSVSPTTANDWHVQGVFASTYDEASDYMSCVVDSDGHLHIAFQNTKGQLVYAKSTNTSDDGSVAYTFGDPQVIDDSGMWIDITMNGTTPYISYISRTNTYDGMRIAYYDSNFDEKNNGATSGKGGWETMTAALDQKVTNVRTCIESNAKANDGNSYTAAVGFCPGLDYRAAFYVGQ